MDTSPSPFDSVPSALDFMPAPAAHAVHAPLRAATPPIATQHEGPTNEAPPHVEPPPAPTWQQDDVAAGLCRSYELGQPKPEGAAFSEVRYWTETDAREKRCDIFDINQPKPAAPASVEQTAVVLPGAVTPALLASLVADGSAAALTYLRTILDDTTVPAALRIKAAQSLLTTLPKQINVTNELVVSSRSYDALMAQAADLLAARGARLNGGDATIIDVVPERTESAAA
jgi:hypothetical protein